MLFIILNKPLSVKVSNGTEVSKLSFFSQVATVKSLML